MQPSQAPSSRDAIALLAGQAFALGLMVAWVTIPASAIFLDAYGSGSLPFTYIGAAAAGAAASAVLTRAFRRRALVRVAMHALGGFALLVGASYVVLRLSGAWVAAVLLVLVPILVPIGFMFVVGQAGQLLDVRTLKASYSRVIAGFALGFVAGGLAAPALLELFGRTDSLLALAALAAVVFLVLVATTARSFPAQLAPVEAGEGDGERPTLTSLARNRYVMLIVGFQMLSAVESQWLDYLVFERAARRYTSSLELADFISRFTAIAYASDILFLLLLAGFLLRRFGLRYGLTANAAIVLGLLAATVASTMIGGSTATLAFVLVVAARVGDLTLSDGTSRTSLSAAYQAVPRAERMAAQAMVEGLAVPVAIGVSGVVLIALQQTVGTDGLALPVLTSAVVSVWLLVAVLVFRGYRINLLANLRHRTLDLATLSIDDANTLAAVDRLIDSTRESEVRLGLQTLRLASHPDLGPRLARLAGDERPGVRIVALEMLAEIDPPAALGPALRNLDHPSAAVRAAGVRVIGATGDPTDLPRLAAHSDDRDPDVQVALAVACSSLGDRQAVSELSGRIAALALRDDRDGPLLAARMLQQCPPGTGIERTVLADLLDHPDDAVTGAALAAVAWPHDADLLPRVTKHLAGRNSAEATEALGRGGPAVVAYVDEALDGRHGHDPRSQQLLTRACRAIGGAAAVDVLQRHLAHRDREVGLAVGRALADLLADGVAGEFGVIAARDAALNAVVVDDIDDVVVMLSMTVTLGTEAAFVELRRALADEVALRRGRLLVWLAVRHGNEAVDRVAFQLDQPDPRQHALALEWLDVTLRGVDRAIVAVLEPGVPPDERLRRLAQRARSGPPATPDEVLGELLADPHDRWRRPYLSACALVAAAAAAGSPARAAAVLDAASAGAGEHASIVHETVLGLRARAAAR